ncbi:MAG: ribonuclease P protein component [Desulfobaccales bacterium]
MILRPPANSVDRRPTPAPTPTIKGIVSFTKADRIRRRRDYLRVQAQGKRLHSRHFGVTLAPPEASAPRLGLVVTRRFGKAVRRNRMKRLLREFFRRHKTLLPPYDLVIMAKPGAAALNYWRVAEELGGLLSVQAPGVAHD